MECNSNVFNIEDARVIRDKTRKLEKFLNCHIDNSAAVEYIDTLIDNDMLYYFEEEAEEALSQNGLYLFTSKQAVLLNIIRNRFKENNFIYNGLFNNVEDRFFINHTG